MAKLWSSTHRTCLKMPSNVLAFSNFTRNKIVASNIQQPITPVFSAVMIYTWKTGGLTFDLRVGFLRGLKNCLATASQSEEYPWRDSRLSQRSKFKILWTLLLQPKFTPWSYPVFIFTSPGKVPQPAFRPQTSTFLLQSGSLENCRTYTKTVWVGGVGGCFQKLSPNFNILL